MRGFLFLPLLVSSILLSVPSLADNGMPFTGKGAPPVPSIYAYPGAACPGGSELYKGPEQKLAAESGAVYCRFIRKFAVVSKKSSGKCPDGMKPHSEANAKPDADVIWCEKDDSFRFKIPALPAQPPKEAPVPPSP